MSFSDSYLKHLDVMANLGLTSIEPVDYQGHKIVPVQFLQTLLPEPSSLGPRTHGLTCIGCVVQGIKDNEQKTVYVYNIKDHQDCYREVHSQAIAYTTGVPAMIGAKLMIEGQWLQKGVWNIEQLDPDPFIAAMNEYGLPVNVIEESLVEEPKFSLNHPV